MIENCFLQKTFIDIFCSFQTTFIDHIEPDPDV
jgi:hypothetical protein